MSSQGRDLRNAVERVGHSVSFKGDRNQDIVLQATRSVILKDVDEGLFGLQRGNYIRIEPIKDIAEALKEHTSNRGDDRASRSRAASDRRGDNRKASATEMGNSPKAYDENDEYEGAINPDGKPNFIATAGKKKASKKKASGSKKVTKKRASRKKASASAPTINDDTL